MIWYSLLFFINAHKQKIVTRVNCLYNDLHNNELPLKRYYSISNYTAGIDHRYKYDNETKLQNANELAKIKTNFYKKKWLETLLDNKISIQDKLSLLKQYDIEIDSIRSFNIFSNNIFMNTDFDWDDFV